MRKGTIALALCGVMLGATALAAQDLPVDFGKARQLFIEKQHRASAHELAMASSAFRGEIGKCKDVAVGEKMLAGEAQMDKFAKDVAAGKIESLKAFDAQLAEFDLLLAKNHQQLAIDAWNKSRGRSLYTVGGDLSLAAGFFKRAMQWRHGTLTPEMQKLVDDAVRVSQAMFDNAEKEPPGAGSVIEALGRAIKI
jgi:hypothetical protein